MQDVISQVRENLSGADKQRTTVIGLGLAGGVIAAWLVLHVYALFFVDLAAINPALAVAIVAVQCWLYVGIFIVAHDCMHGSLAPGRPGVNRWFGRICLFLYAAFDFDTLKAKHRDHHRHAGTEHDPDFHKDDPHSFWLWYARFFREYFSGRELVIIFAAVLIYVLLLGAPLLNVWVFWALPAIVSSLQLFYFGTYLPHQPGQEPFADSHNSRTNSYPHWLSLLTCFHFGYHHEHHLFPYLPWWRLPRAHDALRRAEGQV